MAPAIIVSDAMERPARWREARMSDQDLAGSLGCDVSIVRAILEIWSSQTMTTSPLDRRHGPQTAIRLAIAHALHNATRLSLNNAAAVAAGSWQVSTSLMRVLEFRPRGSLPNNAEEHVSREADPFMLFMSHLPEVIPLAAADEYLDIADGRRVYWRKPRHDAYALACQLHRLSIISRREDTPALREEHLQLLNRLREPEDHICEWIGTVADGRFRAAPERERPPTMRQGIAEGERRSFVDSYATKISVNVSMAARAMKRRALGLPVNDLQM